MSSTEQITNSDQAAQTRVLTESEKKQIDDAVLTAKQNTIVGQFFSQSITFLSLFFIFILFLAVSTSKIFVQKIDQSVYIPQILLVNDFKTDLRSYFTPIQQETISATLDEYWHWHDLRYDLYRCSSEPLPISSITQKYSFSYTNQNGISATKFTIPAKSSPKKSSITINFDKVQELLLTDKFCIERDFSGSKKHDDENESQQSSRQSLCIPIIQLIQNTSSQFNTLFQCTSDTACTYKVYMLFERSIETIYLDFVLELTLDVFEINDDCWYVPVNTINSWRETPWLLLKPLVKSNLIHELPRLCLRHQSQLYGLLLQLFIFGTSLALFIFISVVFIWKKKQYEAKIADKALEEIKNKQKIHSHLNKIKHLIKQK
ncbi:Transmembrane domain-containing protein [Spironucleus salmonicida]|uniref:Transmembrane domain-containing protein n=1 Tax=Spironucleus salmonicida TaxID=348837 RepID=V6LHM0_9EUKA|nr:Transmembrane domain-containing protein [Spironucleus salmonicida]|eukprot:EST44070.1 Transmembrane domain-containing protein [Spironucleus salmonicida]